jgi:ParB family chromosome partitioning protein
MATKRRALGRGLSSLIPEAPPPAAPGVSAAGGDGLVEIDIDRIRPGKHQPRARFDEERVEELSLSIRHSGVIQPVVVIPDGDLFWLVAGERRWRAAQRAGLLRIPAIVREIPEAERLQVSLIENLQREDLNPLEEARAYRTLIRELGLTQAEVASRVGRTRATVSNQLRLLDLPPPIQERVEAGELSTGHARALLGLERPEDMHQLAQETMRLGLSVREVERRVQGMRAHKPAKRASAGDRDPNVAAAETSLSRALRTRVQIRTIGKSGGRVEVHYRTHEELQRVYEILMAGSKI